MERKIGEIFEFGGEWYQCAEDTEYISCINCCFYNGGHKLCTDKDIGNCVGEYRSDAKSICFKKLEKVGEPMKIHNRLVLKVKADAYKCMSCCFYSKAKCELTMQECEHYDCGEGTKFIKIKQNKEDMEEKNNAKHSNSENIGKNLRKFDLEAAKSGKPVCTRDGRKARIICFDAKFPKTGNIVTLVEKENGEEVTLCYYDDGHCSIGRGYDLMMLPEKKEGWVNVYRDCDGANITKDDNIYSSKDAAIASAQIIDGDNYVATTKIKWEE